MKKKVAVVTGSSSGIGAATARLFARHGYNVVINFSRDATAADAVADECREFGAETLIIKANVADDAPAPVAPPWECAVAAVEYVSPVIPKEPPAA